MAARKRSASRPSDLPTIVDPYTGETRVLGTIPSDPRLVASLPVYAGEILPESELREFNEFPSDIIHIKDQDGKGACNWHANAMATEMARYVQGMDHVPLSGWYGYAILCGGVDRGSNILEGLALAIEKGNSPEELMPYGVINPRKIPAAAHEAAPRFRMEAGERMTTFRQMVSATMLRSTGVFSVCVGRTYNNLDSEDVPGVDRGQGNHAIPFGLGLKKSKKWGWCVLSPGSWSERWGARGFCWIAEAHVEAGSYYESFETKAIVEDPSDPENPPIAKAFASLPSLKTRWKPPQMA